MNTDTLHRPAPQPAAATPAAQPTAITSPTEDIRPEAEHQSVTEQVSKVTSEIREGGQEALQAAKVAGINMVSEQKEKFAAKIDEYTGAVKAACESLKADEKNPLAAPAEKAAKQLERAAQYLRDKEPSDLLDDLGDFARRRPEIVYGALFIAGLASVRFLKASSRNRPNRSGNSLGYAGHQVPASPIPSPYQPQFQHQP